MVTAIVFTLKLFLISVLHKSFDYTKGDFCIAPHTRGFLSLHICSNWGLSLYWSLCLITNDPQISENHTTNTPFSFSLCVGLVACSAAPGPSSALCSLCSGSHAQGAVALWD